MNKHQLLLIPFLLFLTLALNGQTNRDAIKIGGGYNLLTQEDVFVPVAYLEYSRVFFPPISIGINVNYSQAKDIITTTEQHDLETFSFDFTAYYSFTENNETHNVSAGALFSYRNYKTDWLIIDTGQEGSDRGFYPGLGFLLSYDAHVSDHFLLGVKGSSVFYNNKSSVYFIGAHAGISF